MTPRRIALFLGTLLLILASGEALSATRLVTDSAGRRIAVPDRIERVFPAGPPAMVFLYVLAPEKLIGWTRAFRGDEAAYVAAPYRDLPVLGRLAGRGSTANIEAVIAARPDLIFDYGSLAPTYVSLAERTQTQTGLPYVLVEGSFENTAAALRLLGGILGVEARAERLARYTERALAEVDALLATVPRERRPRVYLARGPDGLETGVRGSINAAIIERAGAVNVAQAPGLRGVARVSMEQVLTWNPEVIVTWDRRFHERVWNSPRWQGVEAVRNGRVHLSPSEPFGWIDRPPSINRLLGLRWLASVLYPRHVKGDLRAITREFYELFYHVAPSEAELDALLAGSGR